MILEISLLKLLVDAVLTDIQLLSGRKKRTNSYLLISRALPARVKGSSDAKLINLWCLMLETRHRRIQLLDVLFRDIVKAELIC